MKINTSDKIIAYLALLSGLSISAVAVYYSVAGLVSIFAAAALPIMIMGVALEVSKLVATIWLKVNWSRAPFLIKSYLIIAITILMLITSMGIFGYLSKAHLDQAVPTGDVSDKVSLIDEKIKTQKENIDAARRALKQMDEAVDQTMARSADEKGADKAAALRRAQQKERGFLQNDIAKAQNTIASLNEERAPIAKELRKVEAEVGPIKYIAALIYGDNPDQNLLESAVRWVIITIVIVFDPLAVILLLASQYSFQWFRQEKEAEGDSPIRTELVVDRSETTVTEQEEEPVRNFSWPIASSLWPFPRFDEKKEQPKDDDFKFLAEYKDLHPEEQTHTEEEGKTPVTDQGGDITAPEELPEEDEEHILESVPSTEKEAMKAWKADNPDSSLKLQRQLFDKGIIDKLPWENYLKPHADFTDDEAAEEAAKWAAEQLELKKKGSDLDRTSGDGTDQEKQGSLGYIQNAEQSSSTLWQRVKKIKGD